MAATSVRLYSCVSGGDFRAAHVAQHGQRVLHAPRLRAPSHSCSAAEANDTTGRAMG